MSVQQKKKNVNRQREDNEEADNKIDTKIKWERKKSNMNKI